MVLWGRRLKNWGLGLKATDFVVFPLQSAGCQLSIPTLPNKAESTRVKKSHFQIKLQQKNLTLLSNTTRGPLVIKNDTYIGLHIS
jgi:hypothetical protein